MRYLPSIDINMVLAPIAAPAILAVPSFSHDPCCSRYFEALSIRLRKNPTVCTLGMLL